jgi:transcriptional regulator with XRE-family HTH domain
VSAAHPVTSVAIDADGRQRALGARLHSLRRARGLARREVAAAVGVSASFLGMVERGETDMSLARFTRLTAFLGVSVADLLGEDPSPAPPDVRSIASAPAVDRGEGVDYRIIRREHPQLVAVTLAPGARFADVRSHRGEDIWIVVAGAPTFIYGAERYQVEAGNTVVFPGVVEHGVANHTDATVSLIAVCSISYW